MTDSPIGSSSSRSSPFSAHNTGKTHLAVERMLGHATGMIGLPLRLLRARSTTASSRRARARCRGW